MAQAGVNKSPPPNAGPVTGPSGQPTLAGPIPRQLDGNARRVPPLPRGRTTIRNALAQAAPGLAIASASAFGRLGRRAPGHTGSSGQISVAHPSRLGRCARSRLPRRSIVRLAAAASRPPVRAPLRGGCASTNPAAAHADRGACRKDGQGWAAGVPYPHPLWAMPGCCDREMLVRQRVRLARGPGASGRR